MSQADSAQPRGRASQKGCFALVLLAVLAVGTWIWLDWQRGWTVAKLERLIEAEVPPSCDRQQVEEWFERRGIQYWHFPDKGKSLPRAPSIYMLLAAGVRPKDVGGWMAGKIEGAQANVGFLRDDGRIDVYFFFDKEGRLLGHWVERTAPFL
jgi:hypothetical protein